MEKLKKELKKQKDKESTLLEEKDKLKQVQLICATLFLERPSYGVLMSSTNRCCVHCTNLRLLFVVCCVLFSLFYLFVLFIFVGGGHCQLPGDGGHVTFLLL